MTNMDSRNNFMGFLKELQSTIHCQVIRGTFVDRKPTMFLEEGKEC